MKIASVIGLALLMSSVSSPGFSGTPIHALKAKGEGQPMTRAETRQYTPRFNIAEYCPCKTVTGACRRDSSGRPAANC